MSKRKPQAPRASAENKALVHGLQALRFSNAAGKHADGRDKRARTRGASKTRSMREYE